MSRPETTLERRYRRLTAFYPAAWRAQWEEDLVATALEARWAHGLREGASLLVGAARAHAQAA